MVIKEEHSNVNEELLVDEELHKVIADWHDRARQVQNAHYDSSGYYEKIYLWLGIPVIVLSALVGGSEVLVPENILNRFDNAKAFSGVISLCIAVLAGLQTFLKLSQRSERHRMAGARYGEARRSLEEINITRAESSKDAKIELHKIKKHMDSLAGESPELPQQVLKKYRPSNYVDKK